MLASFPVVPILATRDAAKSRPFYEDQLGLPFLGDDGFALKFEVRGGHLLSLTQQA